MTPISKILISLFIGLGYIFSPIIYLVNWYINPIEYRKLKIKATIFVFAWIMLNLWMVLKINSQHKEIEKLRLENRFYIEPECN